MTIKKTKGPSVTDGSQHVADGRWDIPRQYIDPVVGTDPATAIHVDAVGALIGLRITVNPPTTEAAAQRLAQMTATAKQIYPGEELPIAYATDGSEGEITDIYLLPIGIGAATTGVVDSSTCKLVSDYVTTEVGKVGKVSETAADNVTAAEAEAILIHLEFAEAAKVRDVVIGLSPTWDSSSQAMITTEARSYA
jgi:hypothetical protein